MSVSAQVDKVFQTDYLCAYGKGDMGLGQKFLDTPSDYLKDWQAPFMCHCTENNSTPKGSFKFIE